jgi:rubrerythrin
MSPLTAIIVGLAYHPLMRLFHRREMREAMARRGFEICPSCGYWLKGLREDSTRCPECGAQRLTMRESEARE